MQFLRTEIDTLLRRTDTLSGEITLVSYFSSLLNGDQVE